MGCLPKLPAEFPVTMPENAGNMIHGNAPFEMYPHAVFYQDRRFGPGRGRPAAASKLRSDGQVSLRSSNGLGASLTASGSRPSLACTQHA